MSIRPKPISESDCRRVALQNRSLHYNLDFIITFLLWIIFTASGVLTQDLRVMLCCFLLVHPRDKLDGHWSDVCSLFPERLNGGEKAAVIGINVGTEQRK